MVSTTVEISPLGFQTVATLARSRAPFFDLWKVASKSARTQEEMMALAKVHLPV